MQNVTMRVEGNKLLIEVDLSMSFGLSKSGKTEVVASTRGNVTVPGNDSTKIGLNCYRYAEPK